MSRVSDPLARAFYEVQTLAHRWSVRGLKRQRDSMLFERVGLSRDREALSRRFDELDAEGIDPASEEYRSRLGRAYGALVTDRSLLLVMMHGFIAGSTPEIGEHSRKNMSAIYKLLRTRSGWTPEEARDFIAQGMLLNVLLGMQADWRPYLLVTAWLAVGLTYWTLRRRHLGGDLSSTESGT